MKSFFYGPIFRFMSSKRQSFDPSDVILARSEALRRADYGFVYDSYHSQSNFRQHFPQRDDYIQFGWASLGKDFKVRHCHVIHKEIGLVEARVIYLMEMEVNGQAQRYAELAWLQREGQAWRYHRGQKMEQEQLPDDPDSLSFADFDQLEPKIIY